MLLLDDLQAEIAAAEDEIEQLGDQIDLEFSLEEQAEIEKVLDEKRKRHEEFCQASF